MARVDVTMATLWVAMQRCSQSNPIVYASADVWYKFFVAAENADFLYVKTVNAGLTWGQPVLVKATSGIGLALWFDKWTPGDAGTVIHLTYMESTTHDVFYRALDTNGDSLGSEITAFNGASFSSGANTCLSITKSKAGRILIGYDGDGGAETGFLKSDDYPVTAFTAKTNFNEAAATSDYFLLFPGNYADTADIDCVYWDQSASELSLKTYDDSADNWTGVSAETSISTGMTRVATTTVSPQFAGAVRNSDGHLILVAWTAADTLNADLLCWDINGASSITAKADVVTNSTDDQAACAIGIDSTNDDLYVFYLGKTDGSETAYTALNVYYKVSTDDGATWGAETLLTSGGAQAITTVSASHEFAAGQFVVDWSGAYASGALSNALWTSGVTVSGGIGVLVGGSLTR